MKIEKIKKKNSNIYEVILSDNTSLSFYDDTIIHYNLLSNKVFNDEEFKEIVIYNNSIKGYYEAIKYLSYKLRTNAEVKDKLIKLGIEEKVIDKIISRLEREGYINNDLYIKSFINDQISLTLNGPNKIRISLKKLGFNDSDINKYLDNISDTVWSNKVKLVIEKKIKSNHNLSKQRLILNIKQELSRLGYDNSIINKNNYDINVMDEQDILEKEYLKELKKLSRKFEGSQLHTKLKYNLYKKGFSMSDIEKIIN
jgi:regulatory protein